jgi:hypothetical protein
MAAGLPGFGLSGVFFIVSALLMVPIEVVSTVRGRSSLARWGSVLRSAGLALAILAGVELTYAVLHFVVTQLSGSVTGAHGGLAQPDGRTVNVVHTIPVLPILGTLGLVAIVTACGKAAEMLSDLRRQSIHPGADSATPGASHGHSASDGPPRAHRDAVDVPSQRDHSQPPGVEHERFPLELQHALGLAAGRTR